MSADKKRPWWAFWKKGPETSTSSGTGKRPWWAFWKKPVSKTQTKELPGVVSSHPPPKSASAFVDGDTQTLNISAFQGSAVTEIKKAMPPLPDEPPPPPPPPRPGSKRAASPPSDAKPSDKPERSKEQQAQIAADLADTGNFFGVFFFLFVAAFSVPLWLAPWPPLQEAPTALGLSAALGYTDTANPFGQAFVFRFMMYTNGFPIGLLWFFGAVLPPDIALLLLLQITLILTPLCFLALLQVAGRSRWNVFLSFFFLYSALFYGGHLGALLALPVIFLGLAALYAWAAQGSFLAAFATASLAAILVLLDMTAFVIFLLLAASCLLFLSRSFGESLANLLLLSLSLILLAPWAYELVYGGTTLPAALKGSASLLWGDPSERFFSSYTKLTLPLGDFNIPLLAILGGFWLLGSIARVLRPNFRGDAWSGRLFFPLAAAAAFVIYLFFPAEAYGLPLSPSLALVLAGFLLCGSVHLSPHKIGGSLLLMGVTLFGLFHAVLLSRQVLAHKEEIHPLVEIVESVPKKSRLLVWQLGRTKTLGLSLRSTGGYYMASKQGLSNPHLRSAPWTFITPHPKRPLPSPERHSLPSLRGWQYLLTASPIPPAFASEVKLLRSKKGFSLYLILPRP